MSAFDRFQKRSFDILGAFCALLLVWPIIFLTWIVARQDTGASGFYCQTRIGRWGEPFRVVKLRTMHESQGGTVTTENDARITKYGAFFRRRKLDELPQLWNVLMGQMSFVGPRPDVAGYLDNLEGTDKELWVLRPGITGPASLKYKDEGRLLASVEDPQHYNDTVIWPDKVAINLEYLHNWSMAKDVSYIIGTFR